MAPFTAFRKILLLVLSMLLIAGLSFISSCKDDDELVIKEGEGVDDVDGNSYETVIIGSQEWMAENLKTTKYNDGVAIPNVTNLTTWFDISTPAYCWYNNQSSNKAPYGALYNWYVVNSEKLCPNGWHVPTDQEWKVLTDALGGEGVAGGKLKEEGTDHWESPNVGATNFAIFNARPGGYTHTSPEAFNNIEQNGFWWTSTEFGTDRAYARAMFYHNETVATTFDYLKQQGLSMRCVKD